MNNSLWLHHRRQTTRVARSIFLLALTMVAGGRLPAAAQTMPPACDPAPAGLISWWPGEGNAKDIIGGNNGTLVAGSYTNGEVGQAFVFNGNAQLVTVGNPTNLHLQTFTIEAWIKRTSTSKVSPGTAGNGIIFGYGYGGYGLYLDPSGVPTLSRIGLDQTKPSVAITNTSFHHVAVTKSGGTVVFYVDGLAYSAPAYNPSFVFTTVAAIGARGDNLDNSFIGVIDETSVYNRALAPNEIAAIYQAGSGGKCPPSPPVILSQPANQTVTVGNPASFSVSASGTPPLSYQWSLDGTNLANATNLTLTLTDVQLSQAGNYAVWVSNNFGIAASSNAVLTVNSSSTCDPAPAGLVDWWPAQGSAADIIGTNHGTLEGGLGFAPGEVGQAFFFNAAHEAVLIPASQSLNVGTGNGFTLEAWVNCTNVVALNPIFEWNLADGTTQWGVHFYVGAGGPGTLYANVVDSGGRWHSFSSAQGVVATNAFQHAALTYDETTGTATIYCNGQIVAQSDLGSFTPQTSYSLYLGRRPGPDADYTFAGLIDEPSIYNRALSSNEVAAIYLAGNSGKCPASPPVVVSQPTNQSIALGNSATFSVIAGGTPPLSYQWSFNGTNLANATNVTLTLTDVQLSQAGNYAVWVSNSYGVAASSNAVLTVTSSSTCDPVPAGIVAWWPAQGNANDIVGGNNGIPLNGASFDPGEVGEAFLFGTTNAGVRVPASPSLDVGLGSGLTIEGWINPSTLATRGYIVEWNNGNTNESAPYGVQLSILGPGELGLGAGNLFADVHDANGGTHWIMAPGGTVRTNVYQHVALTYAKASGVATLFCNGAAVAQSSLGSFTPLTSYDFYIGRRPAGIGSVGSFPGSIDEMSLYDRALATNEIAAIYQAGSGGKCPPNSPVIVSQPMSQVVAAGQAASFSVSATGTGLNYQWSFNGTNLAGANSNSLVIPNVKLSDTGNYQVLVSNPVSSTNSLIATLDISPSITSPFIGATPIWGRSATLSVGAIGNGTLTYQWYFNGQAIAGAVNPQLDFSSIQLTNSGFYSVVVSSPYGSATNAAYQVVVDPAVVTLGFYPGLTINGSVGNSYLIQRSANLSSATNWQTVSSLTLSQPVELWIDTSVDASSPLNTIYFYQAIPQ